MVQGSFALKAVTPEYKRMSELNEPFTLEIGERFAQARLLQEVVELRGDISSVSRMPRLD